MSAGAAQGEQWRLVQIMPAVAALHGSMKLVTSR
jgi:hypothetical protein